jgi:putative restriction endonuclease
MAISKWSRQELILALNLYLKLPFGKMHSGTTEIIQLASLIGRSPNAVAMRLSNFAHVDPYHKNRGIKGLDGGKKQVQPIWDEYVNNRDELLFESEVILAAKENISINQKFDDILNDIKDVQGETKVRQVKTRVNQNIFRQIVLANYSNKCAITGIDITDLLCASHIIPWSENEKERLNPENGICLSSLYDKAFDKGYLGIDENYRIVLSPHLMRRKNEDFYQKYFAFLPDAALLKPNKYLPKKEFLNYHYSNKFKQN